MKKIRKYLIFLFLAVILIAVILTLRTNKKLAEERVYYFDSTRVVSWEDRLPPAATQATPGSWLGEFEPFQEAKMSAEMPGRIVELFVTEGSVVKKGQALAKVDDALLRLQANAVEVQIAGHRADIARYEVLAEADAIRAIQLEKTELALQAALAQLAIFTKKIELSTVRAAYDGIITGVFVERGSYVGPGVPVAQLTDISRLYFAINVPEHELPFFTKKQSYRVEAELMPGVLLEARLVELGARANLGHRYPVRFELSNLPDTSIRAGMFGTVYSNTQK